MNTLHNDAPSVLKQIYQDINYPSCNLIAVSKTYPAEAVKVYYQLGHKDFGENKVQELVQKYELLPKDIRWHLIGHLQSNKVKYIAPFIYLIHSVDSPKLLETINKEAVKCKRSINCLLQIHIASEDTKFGFSEAEYNSFITDTEFHQKLSNVRIVGLMGMTSNTNDVELIEKEFAFLNALYNQTKNNQLLSDLFQYQELSMGMSSDYKIALLHGSTMVRVGSALFGSRA